MPAFIDPFTDLTGKLKTLEVAGITLPAALTKVQRQLTDYQTMQTPARDRLISALIDPGTDADLGALRAAAYGERPCRCR